PSPGSFPLNCRARRGDKIDIAYWRQTFLLGPDIITSKEPIKNSTINDVQFELENNIPYIHKLITGVLLRTLIILQNIYKHRFIIKDTKSILSRYYNKLNFFHKIKFEIHISNYKSKIDEKQILKTLVILLYSMVEDIDLIIDTKESPDSKIDISRNISGELIVLVNFGFEYFCETFNGLCSILLCSISHDSKNDVLLQLLIEVLESDDT
ncbi:hypothetical protein AGLY_011908, partial [Aphis glycines]